MLLSQNVIDYGAQGNSSYADGGGANPVEVVFNGTNWTVTGK